MYPRVRVRGPEDQVSQQEAASYLLRVIAFLSLEGHEPTKTSAVDHGSKGNIYPDRLNAAISCNNSKDSLYVPKGKSIKVVDEDNRSNTTATTVPRPRAVLSSPENDGIIGNLNKRIQERGRPAKRQASDSNGMTARHSPLTRERKVPSTQHMRIQTNSSHQDQRAEKRPCTLDNHHKPELDDGDVKVEKEPLKICMHTTPKPLKICTHSPLTRERKVPSTQRLYMHIQTNSSHQDQRAEKRPCTLDNHHKPEADDGDVKVEKEPLKICMHTTPKPLKICMHTPPKPNHSNIRLESSFKKSVSSKAGAIISYPKIKSSELLKNAN